MPFQDHVSPSSPLAPEPPKSTRLLVAVSNVIEEDDRAAGIADGASLVQVVPFQLQVSLRSVVPLVPPNRTTVFVVAS